MKTIVYVDAFNLYYGALKGTPFKWLDVDALCRRALPKQCEISIIRYFTAKVQSRPNDPQIAQRQEIYLRALKTIRHLTIHLGRFQTRPVRLPLARPGRFGRRRTAEVLRTEEKGSDVNLATYLLCDGFTGNYEMAWVISNDSDLELPIKIAQKQLGLKVGIINPHSTSPSWVLRNAVPGTAYRKIRRSALRDSQFPSSLQDEKGTFHKPRNW